MKHLPRQPHIILSVENSPYPDKVEVPLSHDDAIQFLRRFQGGKIYSIKGHYGKPEKSILIANPSDEQKEAARALAHMTGQESHIESDGYTHKLIYNHGPNAGKVVIGRGTKFYETEPDDNYSVLPGGSRFVHDFDAGAPFKKARVDEGKTPDEKRAARAERQSSWERENYGMRSGASKDPVLAGFMHRAKLYQIRNSPTPKLPRVGGKTGSNYSSVAVRKQQQHLNSIKKNNPPKVPTPSASKVTINPEHGLTIADAYHEMKHDPNHPEVKAAYNALINETKQQFKDLLDRGLKISKIKDPKHNPYPTSKHLHADVDQGHMWLFPTELGFGSEDDIPKDHPMLQPTEFMHEGKPLLANDIFRVVHDSIHHKLRNGFGPKGEHEAYLEHKKMYSPLAQKALATETMGQNSYVNFSRQIGHLNQAKPGSAYAPQKAGLLPDHIINGKWHE
jgi:hypothetical protein